MFHDCPIRVVLADRRFNLEAARKFDEQLNVISLIEPLGKFKLDDMKTIMDFLESIVIDYRVNPYSVVGMYCVLCAKDCALWFFKTMRLHLGT